MTIQEIRANISMKELLRKYGVDIKRGRCRCFVHNGNDFNMSIYKDRIVHCFVCGANYDIFKVVQHFEQCDFAKALSILGGDKVTSPKMRLNARKDIIKQTQLEIAERRYESAFDKWSACEYMIQYYEDTHDQQYYKYYVFAMQNISYYQYLLEESEAKLFELSKRK